VKGLLLADLLNVKLIFYSIGINTPVPLKPAQGGLHWDYGQVGFQSNNCSLTQCSALYEALPVYVPVHQKPVCTHAGPGEARHCVLWRGPPSEILFPTAAWLLPLWPPHCHGNLTRGENPLFQLYYHIWSK